MNITIWNEYHPSQKAGKALKAYPDGIHAALKTIFAEENINVHIALQEEPENGLTDKVLNNTDVLIWWGSAWQDSVLDAVAEKVCKRILAGMGAVFLHSANGSKPFKKLMGTTCSLKRREDDQKERLWVINPSHPVANGLPETFSIDNEEMFGEYFDIPAPDELVLLGWYPGGEVCRSGCAFRRGYGKIFYFQPGHETYPVYQNTHVRKVIYNAALWAAPGVTIKAQECAAQSAPVETADKKGFFSRWK